MQQLHGFLDKLGVALYFSHDELIGLPIVFFNFIKLPETHNNISLKTFSVVKSLQPVSSLVSIKELILCSTFRSFQLVASKIT